jgi:predicted TIM-barrel fold metal-dependent hydrolase
VDGRELMICDAQVHAPDLPSSVHVGGIAPADLLEEMRVAGVDRVVIVPLAAAGDDVGANNEPALAIARAYPERFAVMGRFDLTRPAGAAALEQWRSAEGMLGIRLAFVRAPNQPLLQDDQLDWFWEQAQRHQIPLMLLVPNHILDKVGEVAQRYPDLRLTVDHLGLTPYVAYAGEELTQAVERLLRLARYPNVAVKATALPASVPEPFPFRSLHDPLRRVVDAFGVRRVFWGSDLTRLACPYSECVRLMTEELPFLSWEDKEWIMGRGVMEWLEWAPVRSGHG